jgi:hypothetical protein
LNFTRHSALPCADTIKQISLALLATALLISPASAQRLSLRGQLRDQVDALRSSQAVSAWESWKVLHGWSAIEAQLRPGFIIDPAALEKVRQKILANKMLDERAMAIADTLQALAESAQPLAESDRADYLTKLESQLVPVNEAELAAARARLKKQLALLEPKLLAYADRGKSWKTYLFWEETNQLLNEPTPARDVLRKLEARWTVAPLAWDIPQIRNTADEIQALTVLLRRDAESVQQLAAKLAAAKPDLSKPLTPEELGTILPLLTALAEMDHGSRLIKELRLPAPPLTTMKMLPAYFGNNAPVSQNFPINGNYGGSYATGNGQLRGNRSTNLMTDSAAARFQVNFNGTNSSQTSSSTQGVRVNSSATSQVNASKAFTFRPLGIVSSPATASATTNLQYTGIGVSGNRFYQNEARNRVQATRGRSQQEAQLAVEQGARESLDKEGAKLIAEFDKSYKRDVLGPLQLQSHFQPRITTNSTKEAAHWQLTLLRPHELLQLPAAPEMVPTMLQTSSHQLFPARMFEMRLGGNTLDQKNWRKILGQQLAERLAKNDEEVDDESEWSIQLQSENPCEFDFRENNVVRVTIRLKNFKNDEYENDNIDLKLKFESQVVNGKWVLKRTEQPEVLFLADPATGEYAKQVSGRELSLRSMLRRRLGKMLGEEIALTPRDLGFPPHEGRELAFAGILCRDQWLVMNLK